MDKVLKICAITSSSRICEGNSEESFTSLPNIHKNIMKNQSSKSAHNATTIFIKTSFNIGTAAVAKLDSERTGVLSIYHVNCEVMINLSTYPPR